MSCEQDSSSFARSKEKNGPEEVKSKKKGMCISMVFGKIVMGRFDSVRRGLLSRGWTSKGLGSDELCQWDVFSQSRTEF